MSANKRWIPVINSKVVALATLLTFSSLPSHGANDFQWSIKVKDIETQETKLYKLRRGAVKLPSTPTGVNCQISGESSHGEFVTRWIHCRNQGDSIVQARTYVACGPGRQDKRSLIFEKSFYDQTNCNEVHDDVLGSEVCLPSSVEAGIEVQLSCD